MESGELVEVDTPQVLAMDDELARIASRVVLVRTIAQAACKVWGPAGGCYCKGSDARCHAPTIYEPEARAIVLALERLKVLK